MIICLENLTPFPDRTHHSCRANIIASIEEICPLEIQTNETERQYKFQSNLLSPQRTIYGTLISLTVFSEYYVFIL